MKRSHTLLLDLTINRLTDLLTLLHCQNLEVDKLWRLDILNHVDKIAKKKLEENAMIYLQSSLMKKEG